MHASMIDRIDVFERSHPEPSTGPSHVFLAAFVGSWEVEGHNAEAAPDAPSTPVRGTETYTWLEGEYFLEVRWNRRFGAHRHTGLCVIGFDSEAHRYVSRSFDNLGFAPRYDVTVEEGVLRYAGPRERGVVTLDADGQRWTQEWERSDDGRVWIPLCHLVGRRG